MKPVIVSEGSSPVVLAMPHTGTYIPDSLKSRLNDLGRSVADTDWWVDRLYDGLLASPTVVKATFSRYVIDANRDPTGQSLYPGANTTAMCPVTDFDGRPIYRDGQGPAADEIQTREGDYHAPYHAALSDQLDRVAHRHGRVVLYDCHSIRSRIPFLFEGLLPVFNIGTDDGQTCDPCIERIAVRVCSQAKAYSYVLNGRFKGGWTTRNYGRPDQGRHAIQLELAQRAYLNERPPWDYRSDLAAALRVRLKDLLQSIETTILEQSASSIFESENPEYVQPAQKH